MATNMQQAWDQYWQTVTPGTSLNWASGTITRNQDGTATYSDPNGGKQTFSSTTPIQTVADHARAKAALEAAHAELTAEQAVLNDRAQKLSADRMEIARLRDEVRKQKPQLAALMEVMEAELPADKG